MKRKIILTYNDYERLVGLMELASLRSKMPENIGKLYSYLKIASMLPQTNIGSDIVTMNSRVRLRDMSNGRETEVTITYPQDVDPKQGKISVFSPAGIELIGRNQNDIACWATPGGVGSFEILEVTFQPEAAGKFDL